MIYVHLKQVFKKRGSSICTAGETVIGMMDRNTGLGRPFAYIPIMHCYAAGLILSRSHAMGAKQVANRRFHAFWHDDGRFGTGRKAVSDKGFHSGSGMETLYEPNQLIQSVPQS